MKFTEHIIYSNQNFVQRPLLPSWQYSMTLFAFFTKKPYFFSIFRRNETVSTCGSYSLISQRIKHVMYFFDWKVHKFFGSVAKTKNVGQQPHFVIVVFLELQQKWQFIKNYIRKITHFFIIIVSFLYRDSFPITYHKSLTRHRFSVLSIKNFRKRGKKSKTRN